MNKKFFNKPIVIICFILYVLLTIFIFLSALTNGKESGEQSAFVWSVISTVFNIEGDYELLIRKVLGHFSFFLILAIFASVVYYRLVEIKFTKNKTFYFVSITLLVGLLTAVISEILQLPVFVSDRGASALDVLIDFLGFGLGFLCSLFLRFIIYRKEKV